MRFLALTVLWALTDSSGPAEPIVLPMGTGVPLVTAAPLSSKSQAKGDLVSLQTATDVVLNGRIVIPSGTPAVGQVVDARAKGAMGMSGRLVLRPLYLKLGDATVRLSGGTREKGSVTAGAVFGMALLTPGFTGRSATIPAGSPVPAFVERQAIVPGTK